MHFLGIGGSSRYLGESPRTAQFYTPHWSPESKPFPASQVYQDHPVNLIPRNQSLLRVVYVDKHKIFFRGAPPEASLGDKGPITAFEGS